MSILSSAAFPLLPGHRNQVGSVVFKGNGEKIKYCRGVSRKQSKNPLAKKFLLKVERNETGLCTSGHG